MSQQLESIHNSSDIKLLRLNNEANWCSPLLALCSSHTNTNYLINQLTFSCKQISRLPSIALARSDLNAEPTLVETEGHFQAFLASLG